MLTIANSKSKLVRVTTIPASLEKLLEGQLRFMNQYYEVIAVSSDKVRLLKYGHDEGVRTYCIEMTRKITPLSDIQSLWRMYLFLRREKPAIVHSHTPKAGLIAMAASMLAGVPNRIHTIAGIPLLEYNGFLRILLNFIERLTNTCATHVLPNSYKLMEIMVSNKLCNPQKMKVIANGSSNGIDLDYFNPTLFSDHFRDQKRLSLKVYNSFLFIFIGRLVKDKGINELIKAFKKLVINGYNVKLLLLGVFEPDLDPVEPEVQKSIENDEHIIFMGHQNDVRPFLAISDALVFPSYREGFPNVVMQAGAMKLPSIVTDINGCNEIISHQINGLVIPVKNTDALFSAMRFFVTHKTHVNLMRNQCRKSISDNYKRSYIWASLYEFYRNL